MGRLHFKFIKRIRRFLGWIWKQEGTPAQRSIGMAIGIFSGCFPLFGFQMFLGILLSSLFKANRLLAIVGTWISNPFTYIPLYWLNFQVGSFFLGSVSIFPDLTFSNRNELLAHGWIVTIRFLLGSSVVGLCFGLSLGSILYIFLKNSGISKFRI